MYPGMSCLIAALSAEEYLSQFQGGSLTRKNKELWTEKYLIRVKELCRDVLFP